MTQPCYGGGLREGWVWLRGNPSVIKLSNIGMYEVIFSENVFMLTM